MSSIFISYRRDDAAGNAGRLYDSLEKVFGKGRVFMDVSGSIEPGTDFPAAIRAALGSCQALIVMIGPTWSTVTGSDGERRLDDPRDWLRLEVATGLKRNIRVIPVLVGGAEMPKEGELPDELEGLSRRQAIELSPTRWDYDVKALVKILEKTLGEAPFPWHKWAASAAAVLAALLVGWLVRTSPPPLVPPPPPVDPIEKVEAAPDITVPSLIGKPFDEAETRLRELVLEPVRIEKVSKSDPEEIVLSQNPSAGTSLSKGSEVYLAVAKYPVRSDDGNQVTEMVFCRQINDRECEQPIFEDSVELSTLPLGEVEPGKPIRVIYFFSVAEVTDLVYILHVWDRDLQGATGARERCQMVKGDQAGDLPGGKDCLIVWMEAEPSPKYRHFSMRSVPGPGLYSVEIQDSSRARLFGSSRRTIRVVDDTAASGR